MGNFWRSGIGKSVLAMQLALGLALGEKTLGLDVFKPAKTLLLHNENPILDERDYFRGIVSQFALDKKPNFGGLNENLRFVCKTGCYYSVDEFISKLDAVLSAGKYDVAIVDSLSSFVHCNFSDHAAVADLFSFFDQYSRLRSERVEFIVHTFPSLYEIVKKGKGRYVVLKDRISEAKKALGIEVDEDDDLF